MSKYPSKLPLTQLMISLGLMAQAAMAAVVITPTGATSTTSIGAPRTISAAISGLGLTNVGSDSNLLNDTHDGGGSTTHWLSAISAVNDDANFRSTTEVLTFDLGGAYDIDTIYYWAYNRPERARGIKTFDVAFSTDNGSNWTSAVSAASLGMSDWTIGTTGSGDISAVASRSISLQSAVTNIRFTNITTFGSVDYIALPEIRFGSSIPEPGAMILVGFGGLLLLRRRRG